MALAAALFSAIAGAAPAVHFPVPGPEVTDLDLPVALHQAHRDSWVRYHAAFAGYDAFFGAGDVVVRFARRTDRTAEGHHGLPSLESAAVRLRFVGAESTVEPVADGALPGKGSYFLGLERGDWRASQPLYSAVRYRDAYPGVDFDFTEDAGRLAYQVSLDDGRKLPRVRLELTGQTDLRLENGELQIETSLGIATWSAPFAYWVTEDGREPVPVAYRLDKDGLVSFEVEGPLRANPLVIDPTLTFSTFLGGSGGEFINALAIASNGNIVVSGSTTSTDFPSSPNALQGALGGAEDAFLTVLTPDGSEIVSSTYLGGRGAEITNALTLLSNGAMAVCGPTLSIDYPLTGNALDSSLDGSSAIFVSVVSPSGNDLSFSTYLDGSSDDNCLAMATNAEDHLLISGGTASTDFPVTADAVSGVFQGGGTDGFLTAIDPAAPRIAHSTFLGGSGLEFDVFQFADPQVGAIGFVFGPFMTTDAAGDIYIGGTTGSPDFLTTPGAFSRTLQGPQSAFVARFDGADYSVKSSTLLGGGGSEWVTSLAVTSDGRVVVGGITSSPEFPVAGAAIQAAYGGQTDAFVTILDGNLGTAEYSSFIGGSSFEALFVDLDAADRVLIGGVTGSGNLPTTSDASQPTFGGAIDTYYLELDPATGSRDFATYIGGPQQDTLSRPVPTPDGGVVIYGGTSSPTFVTTPGVWGEAFFGGESDAALVKFGGQTPAATILHGGSFLAGLAPNTWTSVFLTDPVDASTRLWGGSDFVDGQLPTDLDGFRVTFNGTPGFVSFISPTQFNVLTPVSGVAGQVRIEIASDAGPIGSLSGTAAEFAPGFFMFSPEGRRYVAAVHTDGAFVGPADLFGGAVQMRPAAPGDAIQVFAAGFGPTVGGIPEGQILVFDLARDQLANEVQFVIGGVTVTPSFGGLVAAGLYQFNLTIPQLGDGDHEIEATVGGFTTQPGAYLNVARQ